MNLKKIICMSIIGAMMVNPNTVQAVENYDNTEDIQMDDNCFIEGNSNELKEYEPSGDDGLQEVEADEISEEEMDEIPAYDCDNNGIISFAAYNNSSDDINYSSSRGRDSLANLDNGANMQMAYDVVEAYFEKIHNNYISIAPTTKNGKYILNSLSLASYTLTKDQLKQIFLTVRYDHPEFFWIGTGYSLTTFKSSGKVSKASFYIQSNFTDSNYIKIEKQEIEKAVEEYLDMADYYTDDYDIERVFHDKLIRETTYDTNVNDENANLNSHNVAGALVDHVGVCESYAKTMQLLLNAKGIDNVYVTGKGNSGSHAWNQVKIHGNYYNLDTTWDDWDTTENGGVRHSYFNVKDSNFNGAHIANGPDCSTGTKEYLYKIEECSDDDYTWENVHKGEVLSKQECTDEGIQKYVVGEINKFIEDLIFVRTMGSSMTWTIKMKGEDYDTAKAIFDYINTNSNEIINDDDLSKDFLDRYTSDLKCSQLSEGNTEFTLTVTHKYPIDAESIEMPDKLTIYFINNSKSLNPVVFPESTTDQVYWNSSNSSVASVDSNGVIVPVSNGQTVITAYIGDISKQCVVTVKDAAYLVYKDDLENLYNENIDRKEEDYVLATWNAFKEALDNAKNILDSDNVVQSQVDEAESALKEAIDNLVEVGDKSELQKLYDDNKEKQSSSYTEASWAEFNNVMGETEVVLSNRDAIQEDVDNAKVNLETAIDNLIELGDKSELQKLYDDNKDKQSSSYTEDSWVEFNNVMGATELVLSNRDAIQEEVDNAKVNLETAIDNLVELGDKISLQKLYDSNKFKKEYKYTSETWADFKEALDNTEALLAQDIILKSEADSVSESLDNAVLNLKEVPRKHEHSSGEEPADEDISAGEEDEEIADSNEIDSLNESAIENNIKTGWVKSKNNKWYFYDEKGIMKTSWMKDINNLWYHFGNDGIMNTGWFKDIDGHWYYLNESGDMKTGWYYDGQEKWYHLDEDGRMNTGWFRDYDGHWYYLNYDGSMAVNTIIDGYRVGSNGAWI